MELSINEPNQSPPVIRHDGWTGEAMAKFLETLAETGIVLEACDVACKSSTGAYALRRRDPLFAEAWETALRIARDRLADTLLGRALEGNVEQIIKDGVIVAEKHFLDNRLGLAVLKRLDQRADAAGVQRRILSPSPAHAEPDWDVALTALRTGDADEIAAALAMLKGPALNSLEGDEVGEVCDPPFEEDGGNFARPRLWRDDGEWRTDYPPPPGFNGYQEREWEDECYCRALSDEELAALIAAGIAKPNVESYISIEEDEAERKAFFASLAAEAQLEPLEVPNRVGQEHRQPGDDRDQYPRGEIVDRRKAQEGLKQHQGDAEADQAVAEEQGKAGNQPPFGAAIDPAAAKGVMQRVSADEADGGGGELGHACPFDQYP